MEANLISKARQALSRHDLTTAQNFLRQHVTRHPDDPEGWYLLCHVVDQPTEGIECLQQLVQIAKRRMPTLLETVSPNGNGQRSTFVENLLRKPPSQMWRRVWHGVGYGLIVLVLCVVTLVAGPLLLGDRALVIISGSMEPVIPTGAVVIVQPVSPNTLHIGEVVAYMPGPNATMPRVHRIVSIRTEDGVNYYTTQGDANASPDTGEFAMPPTAWKVWYSVPFVGYFVNFATSRLGFLLLVIVPLLGIGLLTIKEWLPSAWKRQLANHRVG